MRSLKRLKTSTRLSKKRPAISRAVSGLWERLVGSACGLGLWARLVGAACGSGFSRD